MNVKFYRVGGCVRDQMLGVKSKDIDYAVEAPSYKAMLQEIVNRKGEVFLEKPEYLTVRAKVPKLGACDFVLCRKDGAYYDGRRPDTVEPGTLHDDLSRRDFTVNAMAISEDGRLIDPFGGSEDLEYRELVCVGSAMERFGEDQLRMLRAIRFSVTKGMGLSPEIEEALFNPELRDGLVNNVSEERVYEELMKAFRHNTLETLQILNFFKLDKLLLDGKMWLKPTLEKR